MEDPVHEGVGQHAITFELCAQTLSACAAAGAGGAHRIELCSSLEVGGLTPPLALIKAAVEQTRLPIHVLVRPFADSFVTSARVLDAIASSLPAVRQAGAAGVVLGLLHPDNTVDVAETRALVRLAAPLPVTFHRAFDHTPDPLQALEEVVATGCTRILTSGGAPDVLTGAPVLARLVDQAGARIQIAVGGGLRLTNAAAVAELTGAQQFHGSLLDTQDGFNGHSHPLAEKVRHMVDLLSIASDAASRPSA